MKRSLILVVSILVGLAGRSSAPAPAQDKPQPDDLLRDASRRVNRELRKLLESPGAAPSDLGLLVHQLGGDPKAIQEHVRKEIRFEAYPGLQRGPAGVLASGAGNSGDKAFLLAELLRAAGYEARVVRGRLDEAKASGLLAAFKERPNHPTKPFGVREIDPKNFQDSCGTLGLDPCRTGDLLAGMADSRQRRWDEATQLAARETRFVEDQRRSSKIDAPVRDLSADLLEWTRAHYWVRWKPPEDGEWRDVDACFGTAPDGVEAEEVDLEKIPDRFRIELNMDRLVDGKKETVSLLAYELGVHETLLRPVRFSIRPTGISEMPGTAKERLEKIKSSRQFQALLKIGGETLGSLAFDLDGLAFDINANGSILQMKSKVKGVTDLFEDPDPQARKPKIELASVTAAFEIRREGKSVWRQDRAVLEEGGRSNGCPILDWSLFLQSQEFSSRFADGILALHTTRNERLMDQVSEWESKGFNREGLRSLMETPAYYYPIDLLQFCRSRQAYIRGSGVKLGIVWESPNLFISGRRMTFKEGGKSVCTCYGMDIVENGALVLEAGDRWRLRRDLTSALGVFDTVLEQVTVGAANESEATTGTVAAFERVRCFGQLSPGFVSALDADALLGSGLPKSDAEWIRRNGRDGRHVLVAPGSGAHCGGGSAWWEVEASTGRVIGRISGGRGGSGTITEGVNYTTLLISILQGVGCWWNLADTFQENGRVGAGDVGVALACAGAAAGSGYMSILGESRGAATLIAVTAFLMDRLRHHLATDD